MVGPTKPKIKPGLEHGKLITMPGCPKPSDAELENRFSFHPPKNQEQIDAHAWVSHATLNLAKDLVRMCPAGRNLSIALTSLEDVRMRANAALACDDPSRDTNGK